MPWSRSELTIQASNEFGLDLKVPRPQLLVRKQYMRVTQNEVGPIGRWTQQVARLSGVRRQASGVTSSQLELELYIAKQYIMTSGVRRQASGVGTSERTADLQNRPRDRSGQASGVTTERNGTERTANLRNHPSHQTGSRH